MSTRHFMNGGRGARGSINDRLISMMYRKRYSLDKKKREGYTKENATKQKEYLNTIQNFDMETDIPNLDIEDKQVIEETFNQELPSNSSLQMEVPFTEEYQDKVTLIQTSAQTLENTSTPSPKSLHEMSDKMIEVDLNTEVFDFEHYDYYEVLSQYVAAVGNEKEVLDVEQEIEKVEEEETILTELSTFIEESQEIISDIKEELTEVQELVETSVTQEDISKLEEKYSEVKSKVDKLKKQYDVVKEKYNFEDFEVLESIEMMSAIEDYHDKASLEELETLVDACKTEIDEIDGILIEEKRSIGIQEEVQEQKVEVIKRDQDFEKNQDGVIYLTNLEKIVAREAREQALAIAELEHKLSQFSTEIVTVNKTVYYTERMFVSFLRIAAGILTTPFSGRNVFGTMLGTHLINRGMHQLRDSLNPEFVRTTEVRHRYQDIEREILNSKDYVKTTEDLIDDSLYQLGELKEEFRLRFKEYAHLIPAYAEAEKKMDFLQKSLRQKKEEVNGMKKDLDRQYDENKVKVKKAS